MSVNIACNTKVSAFFLVRDKDGRPKVDDIHNCPNEILAMMTSDEIQNLIEVQTK